MRIASLVPCLALLSLACGAAQSAEPACRSDDECASRMSDQCPGGSSVFARCDQGACRFEGCSPPVGTPCDGDPSTVFEGEECPAEEPAPPAPEAARASPASAPMPSPTPGGSGVVILDE